MKISVIIPTLNEQENIGSLVQHLLANGKNNVAEVIVVDGESTDNTIAIASSCGAKVIRTKKVSRAAQMNLGAEEASGDILYFVHADVKLIPTFAEDILQAIQEDYIAGCYRYQFDSPKRILKINAHFTRFNRLFCRGGDQTLFILKDLFKALHGYDEYFVVMEDYDLIRRIQKKYAFKIIPKNILVSARKYDSNSWLRVQLANLIVFIMYILNTSPKKMQNLYKKMLNYR